MVFKSVTRGKGISNLFANFFSSVYTINDSSYLKWNDYFIEEVLDVALSLDIQDIFDAISSLNNSPVSGPDVLSNLFLTKCVYMLSVSLFEVFTKSLNIDKVPEIWQLSRIKPIFKNGLRKEIRNYRGVCNQSSVPKIFESIIVKQLQWIASEVLANQQHGFCKNQLTLSNLLDFYSSLNKSFTKKAQVDFAKAFDRLDHNVPTDFVTA